MHPFRRSSLWVPVLVGAALAAAFAPWSFYPLTYGAPAVLLLTTRETAIAMTTRIFFLAGWVFHSLLLHWLMANVYWEGLIAFVGYQLLSVYLALYWAAFGALWAWSRRRWGVPAAALGVPLCWFIMEFLQARLFTGFGWSALGYTHTVNPYLRQWFALLPVEGFSAVLLCLNVLVVLAVHFHGLRRMLSTVAFVGLLALVLLVGWCMYDVPKPAPNALRVGIIQTNFPQEMKWDDEYLLEMVRNAAQKARMLAQRESLDVIVFPEAWVMTHYEHPPVKEALQELAEDTGAALLVGTTRIETSPLRYYNSCILMDPKGNVLDYYDKVHLAPFGEYIPMESWLRPWLGLSYGGVDAGSEYKVLAWADHAFGPLICFEVLFPDAAEQLRALGGNILVVITNLGWFGSTPALDQELEIARCRAVQTRLPLVHATNTGISGVFDAYGNFTPASLLALEPNVFRELDRPEPARLKRLRLAGAFRLTPPVPRPGRSVQDLVLLAVLGLPTMGGVMAARKAQQDPRSPADSQGTRAKGR
jgi:apolipoprotein N-acyltransferase